MKKIKIGSRKSELALWQAHTVAFMLKKGGFATEIITTETIGDKILNTSIRKIGSKGVFTEEIEEMLKKGDIDIAVHSAKDMPSRLPEGFSLIAFTKREKPNDVLVSMDKNFSLKKVEKPIVVGTSSVRRVAMMKHFYPHVKTVDVRGNLQTRIKKMQSGVCDALMLAFAGIKRMGFEDLIVCQMPETKFVPPVGQGSMAVEVYDANTDKKIIEQIRRYVNHIPTETILCAERDFLDEIQGGCSIPAFALGECIGNRLALTAGLVSLDGTQLLKKTITGDKEVASEIGKKIGREILNAGGRKILGAIKLPGKQ